MFLQTPLNTSARARRNRLSLWRGLFVFAAFSLFFALPHSAQAQALVQTTGTFTSTPQLTLTANFGATPTTGHLIVAVVGTGDSETTVSVASPGATNPTFTAATSNDFSSGPGEGIFYRITGAVETTNVTVTVAPTPTLITLQIYEFSGIDTTTPFSASNLNSGTTTTMTTGNVTPTKFPSLSVAGFTVNTTSSSGTYGGFTNTGTNSDAWIKQADLNAGTPNRTTSAAGHLITTTFGSVGAQTIWTATNVTAWKGEIALFNSATPTASDVSITGRVTDADGNPVAGVALHLDGAQSSRAITDSNGNYRFDNLPSDNFYTVTPVRANYSFGPQTRSFSLLGNKTDATFTAQADARETTNPLDTPEYFVRQQYLDFMGREPDSGGLNYWSNSLYECNGDSGCLSSRRDSIAAAFYIENEFQATGSFVYRLYKASYGAAPTYEQFTPDRSQVIAGSQLAASKAAFLNQWISRDAFRAEYPDSMTATNFVNHLMNKAGLTDANLAAQLAGDMQSGAKTRADVLGQVIDTQQFQAREYNGAFVRMQYFGYLRRNPDAGGETFWLDVLNNRVAGNYLAMVCAFTTSTEYQKRFSSVTTHSNAECGR